MELCVLIILLFLGLHGLGDGLSLTFLYCLSLLFILAFTLSSASTCKINFLGFKTCPVSPYLEWLGVVVKAEEHGPVRCRILYCSTGSLLLGLLLHCTRPSFQGHYGMPSTRSSSAISLGHSGLPQCVLGNISPRPRPWALI